MHFISDWGQHDTIGDFFIYNYNSREYILIDYFKHWLININMIRSILALLLIAVIYSISVPVDSQDDRCMIVFSRSADDYLKIDMKFEKFHGQTN